MRAIALALVLVEVAAGYSRRGATYPPLQPLLTRDDERRRRCRRRGKNHPGESEETRGSQFAVCGGGSFGTAMACVLGRKGVKATLVVRKPGRRADQHQARQPVLPVRPAAAFVT